jgi:RNA polymerase sigma factor (sigma-70 family)
MRTVAALCRGLAADPRPDGELLAAFTAAVGTAESAFTELVRRHGPLVWGTCRRLLHDPSDAEDAFQAAFLVLVRRAGQLTRQPCVGPWLHRVTVWTARNVRRKNARRLARQTVLPDHENVPAPAPDADLKADLDSALLALPSRYRDSIVLCHLLGFTRREAAERLGCPEGTLSGWLNRGLAKLRDRLRGLDPTRALAGGAVAVPAALCASTARAAVVTSVAAASVPPTVSLLVEGVLHMFWVKKATAAAVAVCAVFALGVGVGLGTRTGGSGAVAQEKAPAGEKPKRTAEEIQRAAEIDVLVEKIRATAAARQAAVVGADAAAKGLEALVAKKAAAKEVQDARDTLARFLANADVATGELKLLEAKLEKLKADAKPEPAKPPAPPLNDVFGKPDELEAHLRKAQNEAERGRAVALVNAERLALVEKQGGAAEIEAAKAELAKSQAEAEHAIRSVQRTRSLLAAARAMHAPPLKALGACIEVVVVDGPVSGVCRVREYGRGGVLVGAVLAEDAKALELILSRAMKDPAGPRDLWMVVSSDHPAAAIIRAAKAGKAAGFTQVRLKGTVPAGLEATKAMSEREFDGVAFDLDKFGK